MGFSKQYTLYNVHFIDADLAKSVQTQVKRFDINL